MPKIRTRPGEEAVSESPPVMHDSFVGRTDRTQRVFRCQIAHSDPKRPKHMPQVAHPAVVEPPSQDGLVSFSSHKRQPDTDVNAIVDFVPKRARVNLPVGSKLARRFPQHVQSDTATNGPDVNAVSNKRRRRLPFKTEGSHIDI